MSVVVGCTVGTGWAVLVSVTWGVDGTAGLLSVVDRRRVELVPGSDRFAYHLAAQRDAKAVPHDPLDPLSDGERLVAKVRSEACTAALDGLRDLCGAAGAVVIGPAATVPRDLADIVGSHPAIHTAEGELYRSVMRDTFAALGVEVDMLARRGLVDEVASEVGSDPALVGKTVDELRRVLGPPWRREQKEAALAGWWGLAQRGAAFSGAVASPG